MTRILKQMDSNVTMILFDYIGFKHILDNKRKHLFYHLNLKKKSYKLILCQLFRNQINILLDI